MYFILWINRRFDPIYNNYIVNIKWTIRKVTQGLVIVFISFNKYNNNIFFLP